MENIRKRQSGQAIAIQTTYEKLYQSLKDRKDIVFGVVDYKCYETQQLNPTGTTSLIPYFNKNVIFEDERELRAVIQYAKSLKSILSKNNNEYNKSELVNGLEIKIDISKTIESVYLSPASPRSLKKVVSSLLFKYGYKELAGNIKQSEWDSDPLYGPTI